MVDPPTAWGVAVVTLAYDVAPKGTLDHVVNQVTQSIVFIQRQYPCDAGIYLCRHSAGAHLAAVMLLANWTERGVTPNFRGSHRDRSRAGQPPPSPTGPEDPRCRQSSRQRTANRMELGALSPVNREGMPRSLSAPSPGLAPLALGPGLAPSGPPGALFFTFTGFFLVSGIYDLEPTVHTAGGRSEEQRHLEVAPKQPVDVAYPILVIAGQHDSPEFYRPSREFYQ